MKKRKFWSIMLVCSLLLTLPSIEVFADSIGNINSVEDAAVNIQTESLEDEDGDIGTEEEKESESKEDNELGEETVDPTDTTPEEENKGNQEEPAAEESEIEKPETKEIEMDEAGTEEIATEETETEETEYFDESSTKTGLETEEAEILGILASDDDIASGTINDFRGHIVWVIDKSGKLTVEGKGDYSSMGNYRPPWGDWSDDIKTAEIKVSDMTSTYSMFLRL